MNKFSYFRFLNIYREEARVRKTCPKRTQINGLYVRVLHYEHLKKLGTCPTYIYNIRIIIIICR